MTDIARHVKVTGRVQGVFFRAWTQQQAKQLDVTGWVRNCHDGSVEAHLEGEQSAVQKLIELLHCGPPSAEVDEVTGREAGHIRAGSFEIRN